MSQSRARSLAVSSYGWILGALYSRHGLPWTVHDEVVRIDPRARHLVPHESEPALFDGLGDLGLTARPLVAGEALFARDAHAVLSPVPTRLPESRRDAQPGGPRA